MYQDQDISGTGGYFDIVGEAAKALTAIAPAITKAVQTGIVHPTQIHALQTVLQQGSIAVKSPGIAGRELRRQIAPLPRVIVPKASEVLVTLTPQRPFRVERLVLVSSAGVASLVDIIGFQVGATPQFVSDGTAPLQAFDPTAIATSLRGDTATPGITITLRLQNTDTVNDETIRGMILGEAVD